MVCSLFEFMLLLCVMCGLLLLAIYDVVGVCYLCSWLFDCVVLFCVICVFLNMLCFVMIFTFMYVLIMFPVCCVLFVYCVFDFQLCLRVFVLFDLFVILHDRHSQLKHACNIIITFIIIVNITSFDVANWSNPSPKHPSPCCKSYKLTFGILLNLEDQGLNTHCCLCHN